MLSLPSRGTATSWSGTGLTSTRHEGEGTTAAQLSLEARLRGAEGQLAGIRRELAEARRELAAERGLRRCIDKTPVSVSIQGLDLRYLWVCNPQIVAAPGDIVGKSDFDLLPPAAAHRAVKIKKGLIAGGERVRGTLTLDGPAGEQHYDYLVEALRDDLGRVVGITNILIDVTKTWQAAATLAATRANYKALFDNALHAIAHCRMIYAAGRPVDFVFLAANAAFNARFGADSLVGRRACELAPGLDARDPALLQILGAVAAGGAPMRFDMFIHVLNDWVDFSVFAPAPGECVIVAQVITTRKRAEAELRRTTERLTLAQSAGRVGVFDADFSTGGVFCTPEMHLLFGLPLGRQLTAYSDWLAFVVPEDQMRFEAKCRAWFASTSNEEETHFQIARPDGSRRWMMGCATVIRGADNRILRLIGTVIDVTERRRMEAEIIDASTREQQRIALDLHDGLGQDLVGLSLLAAASAKNLRSGHGAAAGDIEQIATLAAAASQKARAMSHGLAPSVRINGGLSAALQRLADTTSVVHGVPIHVTVDDAVGECVDHKADHLYRIAREAVWNAIKHGKADHISITLAFPGEALSLSIRDNGRGLDGGVVPAGSGIGIDLMGYRAELIGGHLSLHSSPGGGVEVKCVCPIP